MGTPFPTTSFPTTRFPTKSATSTRSTSSPSANTTSVTSTNIYDVKTEEEDGKNNTMLIVTIVCFSCALLCICIGLLFCWCRTRKTKKEIVKLEDHEDLNVISSPMQNENETQYITEADGLSSPQYMHDYH